jgi:hypothetical protein
VRFRAAVFACGLMLWLPSAAAAQSPAAGAVTFVYGISTGVGQRRATGTFTVSEEPAGAGQPPSPRTTASLELDGGIRPAPRLAVMAIYEGGATFGNSQGWGSLAAHAVVRGWVTTGVWIEGGWGLAELAFRPSSVPGNAPIRWWAPSGEAANRVPQSVRSLRRGALRRRATTDRVGPDRPSRPVLTSAKTPRHAVDEWPKRGSSARASQNPIAAIATTSAIDIQASVA